LGIHPWFADREALPLLRTRAVHPQVAAIGETGLDRRHTSVSPSLQEEVFEAQVRLACELRKPLIIHCVGAWSEVMAVRKRVRSDIPWIIHGFRGKAQLADQLLRAGFFLSFGSRCRPEALRRAWDARRLLVETDESDMDIREIYALLSAQLAVTEEILSLEILDNVRKIIPKCAL
jgi:TatD DNase family protein